MLWSEQTVDGIYKIIGERIRARRSQIGLTQVELGQKVRLTRSSIANIESGRQRAMIHTIMQIANAIDIDVSELFPTPEIEASDNRFSDALTGQPESTRDFVRSVVGRLTR